MKAFDIEIPIEKGGNTIIYNTLSREYEFVDSPQGVIADIQQSDIVGMRTLLGDTFNNAPQVVTILPTTNCNARCWYCYEKGIAHYDMTMPMANNVISFIKEHFKKSDLLVNWFGGEPLLNIPVVKYISCELKYAGYNLSTCVTTNGSLITEDLLDCLKQNYDKVSMCITIDDIGDAYANVKRFVDIPKEKAFQNLIDKIKLLINKKIFVLLRINFDDLEKAKNIHRCIDDILSIEDKSFYHIYYAPIWKKGQEQKKSEAIAYLNHMCEGIEINVLSNPYMDNIILNSIANTKRVGYCMALNKNRIVINADGKLYRCHSLVCDEKYACGNIAGGINTNTIGYQLFEEHYEQKCEPCALMPICSTQCRLRSILFGEQTICQNTKEIVPEILKMKIRKQGNKHS